MGYKRLRWGWLCGGVKFMSYGAMRGLVVSAVRLCVMGMWWVVCVWLAWRLSDWVLMIIRG
ncbi:hypothetical protein [Campylobacter lanienae]|uniref:hypothetical protein n=1 Tax=Campylobacter lanienae TaxID=75658 RepID=UPI000BB4092F|nr:hypothetical protein [Campylobacter lanienae]